jgi:hypothetical protein
MREDGFRFDKWLMTTDRDFQPPEDEGPAQRIRRSLGDGSSAVVGRM